MALNQTQRKQKQKEHEATMILETENLMVSPTGDSNPTMRISHFLQPVLSPQNQPPPRPSLHSLTTKTNIKDLTKRVVFKGRPRPLKNWKAWVDDLEKTHQSIWKKAGIFYAIKASTYKIKRDNEIVVALAERWCLETNTFVFPFGEATVSLEDVMVLGGFSVLGVPVHEISTDNKDRNFVEIETALKAAVSEIRSNSDACSVVSHVNYMEYFRGKGGEIEHFAFLVIWLLRYVFPSGCYIYHWSIVKVAPIAFSIARGTKFALAPAVLASIYKELSILKNKIVSWNTSEVKDDDDSKLILLAPFHLVQLWAWERFRTLAPRPVTLLHGEPRLARWKNVKKATSVVNHRLEIESSGDAFLWRPYVVSLKNWELPKFFSDKEMWVLLNSEVEEELLSFARCLSPCGLVGLDSLEQYLPHRVGMQFGYDQDIPDIVLRSDSNAELAWSTYDRKFDGLKLYLPPRLFEGDVTVQYSDWWRSCVAISDDKFANFKKRPRTGRARKMRNLSEILHVGLGDDDGKAPPCDEGRPSMIGGAAAQMSKKNYAPESLLSMGNEIRPDVVLEPVMRSDKRSDLCEHIVLEKHKEINVRSTEPLAGEEMKQSSFVLSENELGSAAPKADNEPGNSAKDPVIIELNSNEEEKSLSESFLVQIPEVEARIKRLERLVALSRDLISMTSL